jgi:uncharacterized membrane protein
MKETVELHAKKETFQLERLAFFTDAVFAIAITLLILEIKVPEIHAEHSSDKLLWESLLSMIPKFIGFLVSFYVIGIYWLAHQSMTRYMIRTSRKLLWNNLLFLLPIVLMPFSTDFLGESENGTLRLPIIIYSMNISLAGYLNFRLWTIIGNPKNLISTSIDKIVLKYNKIRSLIVPVVFICAMILSFITAPLAYIFLPFTIGAGKLVRVYYLKKYPALMKSNLE